jgi:hypothetical protein
MKQKKYVTKRRLLRWGECQRETRTNEKKRKTMFRQFTLAATTLALTVLGTSPETFARGGHASHAAHSSHSSHTGHSGHSHLASNHHGHHNESRHFHNRDHHHFGHYWGWGSPSDAAVEYGYPVVETETEVAPVVETVGEVEPVVETQAEVEPVAVSTCSTCEPVTGGVDYGYSSWGHGHNRNHDHFHASFHGHAGRSGGRRG